MLPRKDYERHLTTVDVMQSVAAVNRRLVLLGSDATAEQARHPRLSKNVSNWLEDLSRLE